MSAFPARKSGLRLTPDVLREGLDGPFVTHNRYWRGSEHTGTLGRGMVIRITLCSDQNVSWAEVFGALSGQSGARRPPPSRGLAQSDTHDVSDYIVTVSMS